MVIDFYLDRLLSIALFQGIRQDILLSAFSSKDYRIGMYEKGDIVHLALERMVYLDVLLEGSLEGRDIRAIVVPKERYVDINDQVDLKVAECLLALSTSK